MILTVFAGRPATVVAVDILRRRFAFFEPIRWLAPARFRFTLPLPVTFSLFFKPLWVFCLGIIFYPSKRFPCEYKVHTLVKIELIVKG